MRDYRESGDIDEVDPEGLLPSPELNEALDRNEMHDVIRAYTGGAYVELNSSLGEGRDEDLRESSNALSEALDSLDDVGTTVYRGTVDRLGPGEIRQYEPGEIVREMRFLSTTRDNHLEFGQRTGNVLWVIESKHGKDVQGHSFYPGEKEVLFDRNTDFRILAREYFPAADRWVVVMEELE